MNLKDYKNENYWFVSKIEKSLREKIRPICGR